jgi:signal transduction histidine kinase
MNIPENIILGNRIATKKDPIAIKANQNLTRVFRNLISNAIDAMPMGGILEIDARIADQDVEIYIKDTGVGIPDEFREEIFNLLSVFSKKRADGGGHGLGLWYCRAFVEACGGELPPPASQVGKGTTFTVRLPLQTQGNIA